MNNTRDIISRIRNNKQLTPGQFAMYQKLGDRQKDYIDKQSSTSAMQAGFSRLPMSSKIYAWSRASSPEKSELRGIYNDAISNHIKNNILYEDDLIEFNKEIDAAEIRK